MAGEGDVTKLLRAVSDGVPGAPDRLMALVYDNLKAIARNRDGVGTMGADPTSIVHEAYVRMVEREELSCQNRHHFFWAAARAMRHTLIERARGQNALKRGGGRKRVALDEQLSPPQGSDAEELLTLDESIQRLEQAHPDIAHLMVLRFFGGLTREQTAEVTGLSQGAVWRQWEFARAWLLDDMDGAGARGSKKQSKLGEPAPPG